MPEVILARHEGWERPTECPAPEATHVIVHDGLGHGDVCSVDRLLEGYPLPDICLTYEFFRMTSAAETLLNVNFVLFDLTAWQSKEIADFIRVHCERSWMVSLEERDVDMEESGDRAAAGAAG